MRAPELPGTLLITLDELAALAPAADHEMLAALRARLRAARLRVLVVGEAKRGKSTLVNALLGREVLPVGVTPLTALATTVTHGPDEDAEVRFLDGRAGRFPLAALDDLVTERGNPANSRAIAGITVRVDAPILARGVEIVDTPGTGSVHAHNTAAVDSALPTMDAAVFVLTADPPVSASERELLGRVAGLSVTTFVVLNKADYLDAAGLAEAMAFTERVTRQVTGGAVRIYPVSARAALAAGGDAGFTEFAAAFAGYVENGRTADLWRSAAGQLRRLAESLLDEVALAQRAARMRGSEPAARVAAFAGRLAAVRERGADAAAIMPAECRRLLADLNDAAEREGPQLAADLRARIGGLLDGELAAAPRRPAVPPGGRQLSLAVGRRYAASTDRLASALETAAALRGQKADQAESRLSELARREQALHGVLGRLDTASLDLENHGQVGPGPG